MRAVILSLSTILMSVGASYAGDGSVTVQQNQSLGAKSPKAINVSHSSGKKAGRTGVAGRKISEANALTIVASRPEVRSWKQSVMATKMKGVTPHIELDRKEGGEYIVHVYEDVPNGDDTSHSATLNWYHVNEQTGRVKTEF